MRLLRQKVTPANGAAGSTRTLHNLLTATLILPGPNATRSKYGAGTAGRVLDSVHPPPCTTARPSASLLMLAFVAELSDSAIRHLPLSGRPWAVAVTAYSLPVLRASSTTVPPPWQSPWTKDAAIGPKPPAVGAGAAFAV